MTDIWTRTLAEKVDQLSIASFGIPSRQLMETAGAGVGAVFLRHFSLGRSVVVLCGHGNNGGDGYVAARTLLGWGASVTVVSPGHNPEKMTPDTRMQYELFQRSGGQIRSFEKGELAQWAETNPVIIDALFGLGLRGPLKEGPAKTLLEEAARLTPKSVIAVDVPSGLPVDDFTRATTILPADVTVTFGAPKPVHVLSPARACCGKLEVLDIGFAPEAVKKAWDEAALRFHLESAGEVPRRPALGQEAHKYTRGHVLVIGGSAGKTGAPQLSALAALRAGAGWVTVALPEKVTLPPELTQEDFFLGGVLDGARLSAFLTERQVKAVVIGPGTMTNPLSKELLVQLKKAIDDRGIFVVLDAAALHQLGSLLEDTPLNAEHVVLTPHPGEWKKLGSESKLSLESAEDVSRTLGTLSQWGVTALYKSATPLVFAPSSPHDVHALTTPSNALGKAGSGDVLTGVLAAFGARGMKAQACALAAQGLLQRNAARFAEAHGADALTAADLITLLSF